jgi:cell shape-determining protein MreC
MKSNAVGIWHETYVIDPGKTENVYVNMPAFGFGKVGNLVAATGKKNTAAERLKGN